MAEHHALYQRAFYYDIALNRDVLPEVKFISDACCHYSGAAPDAVLELACGPAYHARAFARRGIRATGLDLEPGMIDFAREKAATEGLDVALMVADMRAFSLPAPVNVAFALFDALDALTDNEDIVRHFRCVARHLTPAGIYIIDLTHPRDVSLTTYGDFNYAGERDGLRVEIQWAPALPRIDLVAGVAVTDLQITINDHGQTTVLSDTAIERLFVPQELQLLADLSAVFNVVGWLGDYNLNQPLDNSSRSKRMIAILQKRKETNE